MSAPSQQSEGMPQGWLAGCLSRHCDNRTVIYCQPFTSEGLWTNASAVPAETQSKSYGHTPQINQPAELLVKCLGDKGTAHRSEGRAAEWALSTLWCNYGTPQELRDE